MAQPSYVIDLYDSLLTAPNDRTRARVIASAFERLEDRYPELLDLATASGVREGELRLHKEIEQVRADLEKSILSSKIELQNTIHQSSPTVLRWTVGLLMVQIFAILTAVFTVIRP